MAASDPSIKPFAFDRVFRFDAPKSKEEADAVGMADLRLHVEQLEAELERLRQERDEAVAAAHADGLAQGLVQARAERAEAQLAASDALHAALDDLASDLSGLSEQMTRDCADVALKAAEVLAGHAVACEPMRAVEEALERVLEQVAFGTALHMRVHPDSLEHFQQFVASRAENHGAKPSIHVVADPQIAPQDAHISWAQGGLIVDAEERRAAVMQELQPLLPSLPDGAR